MSIGRFKGKKDIGVLVCIAVLVNALFPYYWSGDSFIPQANTANAVTGNMIAFWDGVTIPTGWTCISCTGGDAVIDKFIKGAATYGTTGGSDTTSHTISWVSSTNSASPGNIHDDGGDPMPDGVHAHNSLASGSAAATSTLPAYRTLKVIQHDVAGEPSELPTGLILIFDTSVPAGWTRYSAQDGYFIRGSGTVGTTGGSNTHTHDISFTTGGPSSAPSDKRADSEIDVASATHDHSGTGNSNSVNHLPPYIDVLLGKLDATTTPANGIISMWGADTIPSGWDSLSGASEAFNGKFLRASTTYSATGGGSSSHSHSNATITTGAPNQLVQTRSSDKIDIATDVHTHDITVSVNSANHEPANITVMFAKRNVVGNIAPTITSHSLNNGNDITLVEGTFKWSTSTLLITDTNGCSEITGATSTLYRTVPATNGTTCAQNDNNCYVSTCVATTTGNTCTGGADTTVEYDCGFKLWYTADPTDAGSANASDIWSVSATTSDGTATVNATNTNETVDVNELLSLDVTTSISYGTLDPDTNTGATNDTTTITNTGNADMDPQLSGTAMTGPGTIAVGQQQYSANNFTYGAGTALSGTPATLNITLPKPTATTTAVADDIFWGLGVPAGTPTGSYGGTISFTAVDGL